MRRSFEAAFASFRSNVCRLNWGDYCTPTLLAVVNWLTASMAGPDRSDLDVTSRCGGRWSSEPRFVPLETKEEAMQVHGEIRLS